MDQHEFQCGLCDSIKLHDPVNGHVPVGWKMKKINDRVVQICSRCNSQGHWNGGMSPMLKDLYEKKFGEKVRDDQ